MLLFLQLAFVLSEQFVARSQAAFTLLCWGSIRRGFAETHLLFGTLIWETAIPRVTSVRMSKVSGDARLRKVSNDRRHVRRKN